MKSTLLILLLISLAFFSTPESFATPGESSFQSLDPSIPSCDSLEPSSTEVFYADVSEGVAAASFSHFWQGPDMGLKVISPGGLDLAQPAPLVNHSRSEGEESYIVESPAAGRWTLEVSSGSEGGDFCVSFREDVDGAMGPRPAWFTGTFDDRAAASCPGGVEDSVILLAGIGVAVPGNYSVEGTLREAGGRGRAEVVNESLLYPGEVEVPLEIWGFLPPGPYSVEEFRLYDEDGNLIDRTDQNYTTAAYDDIEAVGLRAGLTGNYSDYGTDLDGDGLYDLLTVDAGVMVRKPGNYSLVGSLYSAGGDELVWTAAYESFDEGVQTMHLDFDGKEIERRGIDGPYVLGGLVLQGGDSSRENLSMEDSRDEACTTRDYRASQFTDPVYPGKVVSGTGRGEVLLSITVEDRVPVFRGRYSYDVVGINIPPISSPWNVTGSASGYSYQMPGVYMPVKPNNFTVTAAGVKNLNVGVKMDTNPDRMLNLTRTWVSTRATAGDDGSATLEDDHLSPGSYHLKIFGEAEENATEVGLVMTAIKKLVIDGDFALALNTTGFPSGNYSIAAEAINGSLSLDEICISGVSLV